MNTENTNWQQSVTGVLIRNNKVLLARHTYGAGKNLLIVPGGYLNYNETPQDAVVREYKEETGDNVINATIEALANEFEKDNIFRTRGAQFAITIDHGNYGQIRKHLENVKENLKRNQEFDIVYGLASSERSSSRMDMVNKARDEMKKMKNDWDLFNKPVDNTDDGYYDPSQYQTANYTQSESYENYNPDNMQDSTPANPNIAVNMMDDPYVDDNTVQEVDATSMDLARQIMEMMTPN